MTAFVASRRRPRNILRPNYDGGWRHNLSDIVVDKYHPHLDGCVACFIPGIDNGTGQLTNLVGVENAPFVGGPVWEASRELTTDTVSTAVDISPRYIPSSYPFAFRFIGRHVSGTTNCYFNLSQTSTDNTYFSANFRSDNKVGGFLNVAGTFNAALGTTTLVDNTYYDETVIIRDGGAVSVYLNGVFEDETSTNTLNITGSTFNRFHIGELERTSSVFFASEGIRLFQVFHGDPVNNLMDMHINPFAFLKSRHQLRYDVLAEAGYWGVDYYHRFIAGTR